MRVTGEVTTLLLINAVASVILLLFLLRRGGKLALCCFLLSFFVPVFGFIMCIIMAFPIKKKYAMDIEETIRKYKPEDVEYVNQYQLMTTVPANDALTISGESERRSYLLGLLRHREMESLTDILHASIHNSDSEASHYAASAVMELQRISYNNMEAAGKLYVPGPDGAYKDAVNYASSIMLYLKNSEIGLLENYTLRNKYEEVMRDIIKNHTEECTEDDYSNYVNMLLKQLRNAEAMSAAEKFSQAFPLSEEAYLLMMRAAYQQNDSELFNGIISKLRESGVPLSPEGLKTIRFWIQPQTQQSEVDVS